MFRIDSVGATAGNLFTEGNPALNVPATVISAEWLNDAVQEELANLVESAGLTLNKADNTQVTQAVLTIIGLGGSQTSLTINNNEAGPTDLTGLVFDDASFKAGKFDFDLFRRTDTQNVKETGTVYVTYNSESSTWDLSLNSVFDDAGVTFSIDASGQVQYSSDNLTGANYSGTLRVTNVIKFEN